MLTGQFLNQWHKLYCFVAGSYWNSQFEAMDSPHLVITTRHSVYTIRRGKDYYGRRSPGIRTKRCRTRTLICFWLSYVVFVYTGQKKHSLLSTGLEHWKGKQHNQSSEHWTRKQHNQSSEHWTRKQHNQSSEHWTRKQHNQSSGNWTRKQHSSANRLGTGQENNIAQPIFWELDTKTT